MPGRYGVAGQRHPAGHRRIQKLPRQRQGWTEAVQQLHRYQRQALLLLAPNVFCVAADEEEFRYGAVLFHDASQNNIAQHLDVWGPRRPRYPDRKGWWNEPEADQPDDPLGIPVNNLLRLKPFHVLDFLQHFGKMVKKIRTNASWRTVPGR